MEASVSPKLTQAPEPESSQDLLDSSSQAPAAAPEEKKVDEVQGDASNKDIVEDAEKSSKTSGEFKKTWGFRRTTIAKRDMPGETAAAESPETRGAPVRRSGRQAKRTDKLEEFLVTVKRGRGAGRRSAPAQLEIGDSPSQTPTDAETASEASFDGNAETKTGDNKTPSPVRKLRGRGRKKATTTPKPSDEGSSENEEEAADETVKEVQEETSTAMVVKTTTSAVEDDKKEEDESVKDPKEEQDTGKDDAQEKECKEKPAEELANKRPTRSPVKAAPKDAALAKREVKPKAGTKTLKDEDDEEDETSSSESDTDGYDPNALYCICRQKHNKRFMICCDRCEEWFHGDCVGITEARGRLMERNGEDYVCPSCSGKMAQNTKAGVTSMLSSDSSKRPPLRKPEPSQGATGQPAVPAAAANTASAAAAPEEKAADDLGIKGRIEKATNPSGKKKIKIFQPQAAASAEGSSLPKCIGPGCERDALPDSVYCGNDCILRHAAAAMKTITTDGKEAKPKEKAKTKMPKKAQNAKSTLKRSSGPERRSSRRSTESSSKAEEGTSESEGQDDPDSEDDEDKLAVEQPPHPAMSSWSSDHNYIAVTPEKTTPISPSVLNKACMYLSEGFLPYYDLSLSNSRLRTHAISNTLTPIGCCTASRCGAFRCVRLKDLKFSGSARLMCNLWSFLFGDQIAHLPILIVFGLLSVSC